MKRVKVKSIGWLKKECDRVFSLYIRKRDPFCVTCGKPTAHAGHYVPRNWLGLRYDERNVAGQCIACNIFKKGNLDNYALHLLQKYGIGILQDLKVLKVPTSFKRADYMKVIEKYKESK